MSNEDLQRERKLITQKEKWYSQQHCFSDNNKAWLSGTIEEEVKLSYESSDIGYYTTKVKTQRTSGKYDVIPVVLQEKDVIGFEKISVGQYVEIGGKFRSYNDWSDGKSHLKLFLYASMINVFYYDGEFNDENTIYLKGFICKKPVYRITPLKSKVTDVFLAVNRKYGKTDYIPCIAWGKNALFAKTLNVGDEIEIFGRMQSRDYFKRDANDPSKGENKVAYEISIAELEKC